MASITIRKLDEGTKAKLRIRAAHRHRSMEEEARQILREALTGDPSGQGDLAVTINARFRKLGGVELELPPRQPMREPPRPRRR